MKDHTEDLAPFLGWVEECIYTLYPATFDHWDDHIAEWLDTSGPERVSSDFWLDATARLQIAVNAADWPRVEAIAARLRLTEVIPEDEMQEIMAAEFGDE